MRESRPTNQQGGFILALALIMMLFVGIVVITSSERTGQETRTAQSQAPTATLQAAAEAGLFTLRQKINEAGQKPDGICKDEAEDGVEEFCKCVKKKVDDSGLGELMGVEGYLGSEALFSSKGGFPDIYWWFNKDHFEANTTSGNGCFFESQVYAGNPSNNQDYFMRGKIAVSMVTGVDELDDLLNGIDWDNLDMGKISNLLDKFYGDSFSYEGNENVKPVAIPGGEKTNLGPDDLVKGKINLIVMNDNAELDLGGSGNPNSLEDMKIIIVSRSGGEIIFSNSGKDSSPEGLIVAPSADLNLSSGANEVNFSAISKSCVSGSSSKPCDQMAGGAKLSGYTTSKLLDGSSDIKVASSEEIEMDFDY